MEGQNETGNKIKSSIQSPVFLVPFLSFCGYLGIYYYLRGYLEYFGLSVSMIKISYSHILNGFSQFFVIFLFMFSFCGFVYRLLCSSTEHILSKLIICWTVFFSGTVMHKILPFNNGNYLNAIFLINILLTVIYTVIANNYRKAQENKVLIKTNAVLRRAFSWMGKWDIKINENSDIQKSVAVIAVAILSIILMTYAGRINASEKNQFYMFADYPDYVSVYDDQDQHILMRVCDNTLQNDYLFIDYKNAGQSFNIINEYSIDLANTLNENEEKG